MLLLLRRADCGWSEQSDDATNLKKRAIKVRMAGLAGAAAAARAARAEAAGMARALAQACIGDGAVVGDGRALTECFDRLACS